MRHGNCADDTGTRVCVVPSRIAVPLQPAKRTRQVYPQILSQSANVRPLAHFARTYTPARPSRGRIVSSGPGDEPVSPWRAGLDRIGWRYPAGIRRQPPVADRRAAGEVVGIHHLPVSGRPIIHAPAAIAGFRWPERTAGAAGFGHARRHIEMQVLNRVLVVERVTEVEPGFEGKMMRWRES